MQRWTTRLSPRATPSPASPVGQPPSCVDPGAQPVDPDAAPDAAADLKDRLRLVNEIIDDLKDTHAGEFEGLIFKYI